MSPALSVVVTTYNHESYIRQCLESILMQKTDFPVEVIIANDGSTDGSDALIQSIVARHPEKVIRYYYHTQNLGYMPNVHFALSAATAPLVAYCEGDDFWTDPLKLQKQVEHFRAHPECDLLYTDINLLYQETGLLDKDVFKQGKRTFHTTFEGLLLYRPYISPCTWVIRRPVLAAVLPTIVGRKTDATYILGLEIAKNYTICFLTDTTATYRIVGTSISNPKSLRAKYEFNKGLFEIQKAVTEKYGCTHLLPAVLHHTDTDFFRKAVAYNDQALILDLRQYLSGGFKATLLTLGSHKIARGFTRTLIAAYEANLSLLRSLKKSLR